MPGGTGFRRGAQLPAGNVHISITPPYKDFPVDDFWGPVVIEDDTHIRIECGEPGDTITADKRWTRITRSLA